MTVTTQKVRRSPASKMINVETYTSDTNLVVTKAPGAEKPFIGGVYRMSPLAGGGGEFSTVVQNVFKAVPDDSVIQVSLLVHPDHEAPATFRKGKNYGGHVIQDLIRRQAGLFHGAATSVPLADLPMINNRTVYISLAVPHRKVDPDALEHSENLQGEFFTNLRDCGFYDVKQINASELVAVYRQFANIYEPAQVPVLDQTLDIRYQIFGPDQTFNFSDPRVGVINENTHCSVVTVKSYPEDPFHGIMNLVSGAPFNKGSVREGGGQRIEGPYILTTTVRVANQRKEWTRIESAIRSRKTFQPLPIKLGVEDSPRVLADLEELKKQCAEDGTKFVYVSTNAFLFGRKRDEAVRAGASMKGTFDKLGFDGRTVVGTGLVRLAQAMPLNFSTTIANDLAGEAVMASSAVGSLLPVYGDYLGNVNRDFPVTGMSYQTRRGSMHYFDPYISDSNFNGVVAAAPGAGKSFNLQYMIECDLAQGANVVLMDNGRSGKKMAIAVGGEYNEFGGAKGWRPSLQPFTNLDDDEFDEQQETITSLHMLMAYDDETPDPAARIAVSEAVKAAWAKKGRDAEVSTVIDCLQVIVDSAIENTIKNQVHTAAANLIPRLKAFVESPTRGPYFRGPCTLDPRAQFTVFELAGLGDDNHLKRVVLFCCVNVLISRIKTFKGRKRIYVDEAHDLFAVDSAADAFEGIYLKGRKDEVAVWIIVQSLLKLWGSKAGAVILRQSAWKVIMAQKSEEIDAVIKEKVVTAFADDPYFNKLLRSVESRKRFWSEMLIMSEKTYEVVRLYVDKFTATLFGSEGDDRDEVLRLIDEGMDALEAVTKVMGDKKARRREWMRNFVTLCTDHDGLSIKEILSELKELHQ
ncbi:conjugal transfer protein TraC [Burkholderia stagnalis]|nr:conjugal transfer protein TraC [Burkholderia stagnalis]